MFMHGLPFIATMMGVKQVYPGKYEPEMLINSSFRKRSLFPLCATILQMLVASPIAKKIDLSAWKVIIGGARFPRVWPWRASNWVFRL